MVSIRNSLLVAGGLLLAACGPSASVMRTTPVADLQSYQTALVRVAVAPGLERFAPVLEFATADSLRGRCNFGNVVGPSQLGDVRPDLILDLNIRGSARGGSGFVQNPNVAEVNVTMVLSDGLDESLLGSADITGKSSAVALTASDPENEALVEVGKRVAAILVKSGCVGQRIARTAPDVERPQPASNGPALTEKQLAQAEAANDEGKRFFRAADIPAAKAQFELAIRISRDPRFYFNLCLAHEGLDEYEQAVQACEAVVASNPDPALADKANKRLAIIAEKRGV